MSDGCDTRASEKLEGGQEAALWEGGGDAVTTYLYFCVFVCLWVGATDIVLYV